MALISWFQRLVRNPRDNSCRKQGATDTSSLVRVEEETGWMTKTKIAATGHTRSSVTSLGVFPLFLLADLSWSVAAEVQESSAGRERSPGGVKAEGDACC